MAERGAYWGLRFCTAAYRLLGRRVCMVVIAPIVVYFYAAGRPANDRPRGCSWAGPWVARPAGATSCATS